VKYPSGVIDSTGYSSTVAIPIWAQTGPDSSRRVNFAYNTRNQVASVRPPGHSASQLYTYAYDSQLGNLQEVQSPLGRLTTIYSDLIGRDTLTRSPLATSKWLYEFKRYDKRDLITRQMTTHDSISGVRKDSAIVANAYDDEGNLLSAAARSWPDINAIDTVTRVFSYDAAYRQRSEVLVNSPGSIVTMYDAAGNVVSGGREGAAYTYDVLNRPVTRTADDLSTFTYDSTGLRTANNPYAQVKRSYYRNGSLKTDSIGVSVSDTSLHDFSQKYGLNYTYDLNGRRTAVSHPSNLVPVVSGQTSYAYSAATGELATVTDVFGNQFAHTYDGEGRLKTLTSIAGAAQQIVETRWYDLDGKLVKRVAGGSGVGGSTGLRNDTLTYDLRGKALGNGFYTASYTPLGYLGSGNLGGQPETFLPDAFGNSAGGSRGSNGIVNRFQARTGRITFTEEVVPGGRDTTLYYYTMLGAVGDKVHIQYLGGSPPNVQQVTRSDLHTYAADNKLTKVFVQVDSTPPPAGIYKPYRFEETYRYDALGRRIETRLWRTTNCPSKDPDSGCQNTLTRTIWDGSQMLYELRWLFASTDTIPGAWSTGNGVPGDGTYWGTVGYTHGLGIDQPLDLFRGSPVVVPHANWRGMLDQGTCPTAFCPGDSPAFPGKLASAYGETAPGLHTWYGTLIGGMTDASGYLYRRNRYVDPSNGRFTQEDPIGLAGGINLYGFASGDPVNFSDPFGVCPKDVGGDGKTRTLSDCPPGSLGWNQYASGAIESADPFTWFIALGEIKAAGLTLAAISTFVTRKAINLPAWRTIGIDMAHVAQSHMTGGAAATARRTVFPVGMSETQVERAIRTAYRTGEKIRSQGNRVLMRGKGAGMTIEMWVNRMDRIIETAYPIP
jgi:RHS repeat-associated protein